MCNHVHVDLCMFACCVGVAAIKGRREGDRETKTVNSQCPGYLLCSVSQLMLVRGMFAKDCIMCAGGRSRPQNIIFPTKLVPFLCTDPFHVPSFCPH